MLGRAVLIIVIMSNNKVKIDHEKYTDVKHCQAVAEMINEYNKDNLHAEKVASACLELSPGDFIEEV